MEFLYSVHFWANSTDFHLQVWTISVVWLMNWKGSKAIEETTSFKLIYRKKLKLRVLKEWEDKVLIYQADIQSKSVGFDKSNSFLIYFPDTNIVKAKCNFCFISTSHSRPKEKREATSKF